MARHRRGPLAFGGRCRASGDRHLLVERTAEPGNLRALLGELLFARSELHAGFVGENDGRLQPHIFGVIEFTCFRRKILFSFMNALNDIGKRLE